jgi:UDP-N-acetylmuramoyl-L-alanyl-D-glutamate--2,6-diaminopimelate ligase
MRKTLNVPIITVSDSRLALAKICREFYGLSVLFRSGYRIIGVTGTNGKTTTCYMLQSILAAAGERCGRLGTVEYDLVGRRIAAPMTTPDAGTLSSLLAEIHRHGGRWAVMEASSHALDQKRTAGIEFAAAVFTNLSGDHLDYHESLADYLEAKSRLFRGLGEHSWAILNADDPHSADAAADIRANKITFGIANKADVTGRIDHLGLNGVGLTVKTASGKASVNLQLIGQHNAANALGAAAAAHALGVGLDTIAAGLEAVSNIPGRLQRIGSGRDGPVVLVDYAHTDDALVNVLNAIRPLAKRRLVCVFGCGGDRDRGKRPRMARAAERFADVVVVTSDNPRTEDPDAIIAEIASGFVDRDSKTIEIQPNRGEAIEWAIRQADDGDVVVIAGKGHEQFQQIGARRIPFDDVKTAEDVMRRAGQSG